jgi:hypothetical protein
MKFIIILGVTIIIIYYHFRPKLLGLRFRVAAVGLATSLSTYAGHICVQGAACMCSNDKSLRLQTCDRGIHMY